MQDLDFEIYAKLFTSNIEQAQQVDSISFKGRCCVCGDSKKDPYKCRLYLIKERGDKPALVYCHNCGLSKTARVFFKENFLDQVEEIFKSWDDRDISVLKEKLNSKEFGPIEIKEKTQEELTNEFIKELKIAKDKIGYFFNEFTDKISNNTEASKYMLNRYIPNKYISEMRILKPEYYNRKKFQYAYFKDYIFIPFIDKRDNKPYYFHSRKFRNQEYTRLPSYLMCPYRPFDVDVKFYLNELRVNKSDTVFIIEGSLDSLNVSNSLSVNGIKKLTKRLIETFEHRYGKDNIVFVIDNELIDKDAKIKYDFLKENGKRVFSWEAFSSDFVQAKNIKDINKLCVLGKKTQFPTKLLEKYS